jgi:hypothetical protein
MLWKTNINNYEHELELLKYKSNALKITINDYYNDIANINKINELRQKKNKIEKNLSIMMNSNLKYESLKNELYKLYDLYKTNILISRECKITFEDYLNSKVKSLSKVNIDEIKILIEKLKQRIIDTHNDISKNETILNNLLILQREYVELESQRLHLENIKNLLDKNGLVDNLLSNHIIPCITNNINNILLDVGHYSIVIEYKNQSINIYKKHNLFKEERGLNAIMSSGYESYLLDLVFRLALVQINNHIKTNFLIIDEGFNSCDISNKNNIKLLLEFMRTYYSWILIISHDDFIKSFYDMSIDIKSINNYSQLKN